MLCVVLRRPGHAARSVCSFLRDGFRKDVFDWAVSEGRVVVVGRPPNGLQDTLAMPLAVTQEFLGRHLGGEVSVVVRGGSEAGAAQMTFVTDYIHVKTPGESITVGAPSR